MSVEGDLQEEFRTSVDNGYITEEFAAWLYCDVAIALHWHDKEEEIYRDFTRCHKLLFGE